MRTIVCLYGILSTCLLNIGQDMFHNNNRRTLSVASKAEKPPPTTLVASPADLPTGAVQNEEQPPIAYAGEVMLKGWSDSSTNGRTVTLILPGDEPEHPFRRMATATKKDSGQRFMMVLVGLLDDETPSKEIEAKRYGRNARELHRFYWFNDLRVMGACGTPANFKAWVMSRPCLICKEPGPQDIQEGPGYSAFPLCARHWHTAPESLATKLQGLQKDWVASVLLEQLGTSSLGETPPNDFHQLCKRLGIEVTIPETYFSPLS